MKIVAALPNVELQDRKGIKVPDSSVPMDGLGFKPMMLPKTSGATFANTV